MLVKLGVRSLQWESETHLGLHAFQRAGARGDRLTEKGH